MYDDVYRGYTEVYIYISSLNIPMYGVHFLFQVLQKYTEVLSWMFPHPQDHRYITQSPMIHFRLLKCHESSYYFHVLLSMVKCTSQPKKC